MAAIRAVLVDKFGAFGNPFVSLATSFTSMLSSPPLNIEDSKPKADVSGTSRPDITLAGMSSKPNKFTTAKSMREMIVPRTNLKQLVTGENDFSEDSPYFIVNCEVNSACYGLDT